MFEIAVGSHGCTRPTPSIWHPAVVAELAVETENVLLSRLLLQPNIQHMMDSCFTLESMMYVPV